MIMQSFKGTRMAWVKNYIDQFVVVLKEYMKIYSIKYKNMPYTSYA